MGARLKKAVMMIITWFVTINLFRNEEEALLSLLSLGEILQRLRESFIRRDIDEERGERGRKNRLNKYLPWSGKSVERFLSSS